MSKLNKIWKKETDNDQKVDRFTVGDDRELDGVMAEWDVIGSMAHCIMLEKVGLLEQKELKIIIAGLKEILQEIEEGNFKIEEDVEDIHSQVEGVLTQRYGDVGKKIHSGRSRNDQVLVDLKLYFRHEIEQIAGGMDRLFDQLMQLAEKHQNDLMPGYTHLQLAMPSSFGLWFGAYAESLSDDLIPLLAAWKISNKNPLGSAAGYGSSFPLDRRLTTQLLGFDDLHYNVVYAQMGRGKTEKIVADAIANIAATLGKMAMDTTLYLNQHFSFISFPDHLTTGSSIMPHKKNPDVFELIRARCNELIALPSSLSQVLGNLPSGYHRDLQQIKSLLFPAIAQIKDLLDMMKYMMEHIQIRPNILEDNLYTYLFSVEEVNKRVLQGMPFREAYKEVGLEIEAGKFRPERKVDHSHEGSIGQLMLDDIRRNFAENYKNFNFEKVKIAINNLKFIDLE